MVIVCTDSDLSPFMLQSPQTRISLETTFAQDLFFLRPLSPQMNLETSSLYHLQVKTTQSSQPKTNWFMMKCANNNRSAQITKKISNNA